MKLHELKEFTLYYILEHDKLTKKEKLQLGEFVKEANEDQINHLLLTGRPCGGKDAKDFVEKNSDLVGKFAKLESKMAEQVEKDRAQRRKIKEDK